MLFVSKMKTCINYIQFLSFFYTNKISSMCLQLIILQQSDTSLFYLFSLTKKKNILYQAKINRKQSTNYLYLLENKHRNNLWMDR